MRHGAAHVPAVLSVLWLVLGRSACLAPKSPGRPAVRGLPSLMALTREDRQTSSLKSPRLSNELRQELANRKAAPPTTVGGESSSDPRVLTSGDAIRGLYDAFNRRNASLAASFLAEDCIYEDLLLGPNTICRGKSAFASALEFHPAFVTSALFSQLPFASYLPELTLVVDSVAEGFDTVGVEWHVEVGSSVFPLGRGLTQAKVDPLTGEITRVVDIAEAPWRVIGLLLAPVVSILIVFSELAILRR